MAHNENYIGNYSPSSFEFLHQDSPLNVDLSSQLDLPSVRDAHEWLQVFPISTDCGVNLQTPILEFDPDDIILQLKQQRKKHGNRKTTKLEQDGNAACTAYMDQVFFKILIDVIEKDYGESVAATVKIL
ncbi:unnamed protein product [Orchesella dallaii]|uniref:Uncharacterized protein n=1 Tax=Orchesella dallaii TaxID=48710 RepID=A0ABP1PMR4_9HEXA